ncbi:heavy metal-associated isoprenylated plant protein 23-like [Curcuma longa]|uniref:heavy metal-associated isoprenylated plant protein 23-like n=1 Tax=Curcuma longa TaxID=136217 RepID=UPI003D9DEC25
MGGAGNYFSNLLGGYSHKRKRQFQTVELKVRMDCEGCELKVRNALASMKGVQSVDINRKQYKVTVIGYIEPSKVVKRVQSTGKRAEIWPYVPYNLVTHPYNPQTYDKKAPAGHVRNVEVITMANQVVRQEDKLSTMFSDDNPNACSIM